jgi:6-phosphogluconolactonase
MTRLFIGSVSAPNPWFRAAGEGVTVCELDETTGVFARICAHSHVENAMWMIRAGGALLVASERHAGGGEIGAFDAAFRRVGVPCPTPGSAICHMALSPDGNTLYAASYIGGVTAHALGTDGSVAAAHHEITYVGSGPNRERQEDSHPHQAVVSPDGDYLFVCDLGCDKVWIHSLDGGKLERIGTIDVPAGCGPRHLVFHPTLPRLYLLSELDGVVRVYEGRSADWKLVALHTALPGNFCGTPGGAAIRLHPSGRTLAASVRGSDTVAVFDIDTHGDLTLAANFSAGGKTPRDFDFTPSGRWLVALNQDSDNAVAFRFDTDTGLPTGHAGAPFAIGCPVCVIF